MRPAPRPGRRAAPRTGSPGAEVTRVLWAFRREHDWRPGLVWDPFQGRYVTPAQQTYTP